MESWLWRFGLIARMAPLALALVFAGTLQADAHHLMGGRTPETFMQGLLSGLGHPVIGLDHLAFIVAMGVAVGMAGLHLGFPGLFVVASALGVALHAYGASLPAAELVVDLSVLAAGALIASGWPVALWGWGALFAAGGLFHGYAFGDAIYGAEPAPLAAYLVGLAIVQAALATAVAMLTRRSGTNPMKPRLAGAAVAGIGIAILAGQILPT